MLTVNVVIIPGALDVDIFQFSQLHPDEGQEDHEWRDEAFTMVAEMR